MTAQYRADVGAYVRSRLGRTPNAMPIPSADLELFVVRDFLSREECDRLMRLIDADRVPSSLLSPTEDPEFRTSESCNLHPAHPDVRAVEDKIWRLIGIQPELGETIQGQRYAPGQQFKPHHDFFHPNQPYWPEMERTGGQRTWTAMIFLNTPQDGGKTRFPEADIAIAPRAGNLLAWNNMDAQGEPNPKTLHAGTPVVAGVKYVITKWYRERAWIASPGPTM